MVQVTIYDIMNTLYNVISLLISIIFYLIRSIASFFFKTLLRIMSYVAYLLPFSPFALVIICIFLVLTILWDEVTRPLIYYIIEAINGIIAGWNKVADGVRNIGFRMPGSGYLRIGGIDLPRGDEINVDIPNFWDFIFSIILPVILLPLKKALTGIIIRE